jgi:hypothetical protein
MAISTDRVDDLNVDRLLYLSGTTAVTLESIDHWLSLSHSHIVARVKSEPNT